MTWFSYNLLSVLALASAELCQQHLLVTSKQMDARTSAISTFFVQAILALAMVFLLGLNTQLAQVFSPKTLPLLLSVCLIGSVAMVFYLQSFKVKSISFSLIFISWSAVVSTALGIVFLSESTHALKFAGMALVLGSLIILNFRNLRLESNHLFALMAGFLFGLTYTLDKTIVLTTHPLVYMFWGFLLLSIFGFLQKPVATLRLLKALSAADGKLIILSALAYFIFNFCTFKAYTLGAEVGRVDAINNSQVFVVIGVEYFIFKQQEGIWRKIISAAFAMLGVTILGYF